MAFQSTKCILDPHMFFEQASEFERAEIDGPDATIDFFEADLFPDTRNGDVDPLPIPANAAVGTDLPNLEAVRETMMAAIVSSSDEKARIGSPRLGE